MINMGVDSLDQGSYHSQIMNNNLMDSVFISAWDIKVIVSTST